MVALRAPGFLPFRVRSKALAQLMALEVLPQLERIQIPAGTSIPKADAEWLFVVESGSCTLRTQSEPQPMPAGSALSRLALPARCEDLLSSSGGA